ncbi:MAG TPA: MarR family transcriptional regulator [Gammaproteobacteria bacterium]|nr:MarR family transcriptional regulator [Gammaproteobacteria bacterium]
MLPRVPTLPGRPIGLRVAVTAKAVRRAFDEALVEAGGSLPTWLVLVSVKGAAAGNQRELADAAGIKGATLTHHLNALEKAGLVTRRRDPDNRRVHVVELTSSGEALFQKLRGAAAAFDKRLRTGLTDAEVAGLARLLDRLSENAGLAR